MDQSRRFDATPHQRASEVYRVMQTLAAPLLHQNFSLMIQHPRRWLASGCGLVGGLSFAAGVWYGNNHPEVAEQLDRQIVLKNH